MEFNVQTNQLIESDIIIEPFQFAMWILQNNSKDFIDSVKGSPKIFAMNGIELFSIYALNDLGREREKDNLVDSIINYENEFDSTKINFGIIFYDESLCEVQFNDYVIRLHPQLIYNTILNGSFSFDKITQKGQNMLE